jgi:protocatechuate 3,4-dioxygenase beta subunit
VLRVRRVVFLLLVLVVATQCVKKQDTQVSQTPSPTSTAAASPQSSTAATGSTPQAAAPCSAGANATLAVTEGPYFKAGSPEKTSLIESGMKGTKLVISGYVLNTNCQPISKAKLDWWHADADGDYDNSGYRLRGHELTDSSGAYKLETIVAGLYTGRTRHIHVKVEPPGGRILTTQLFFPGEAQNDSDGIFREELLMSVQQTSDGESGRFDFIVQV